MANVLPGGAIVGRLLLSFLLFAAGIVLIVYTVASWFQEPTLTQMQMLQTYWPAYLLAVVCIFAGGWLLPDG